MMCIQVRPLICTCVKTDNEKTCRSNIASHIYTPFLSLETLKHVFAFLRLNCDSTESPCLLVEY